MTQAVTPERREDWFDDAYVSNWIERQAAREPMRSRQFAMLRAMIPFELHESFRYLNVGAGHGPLDDLILDRYPNARATLLDGSPVMLGRARELLDRFGERADYVQADLATPEWVDQVSGPFDAAVSCIAIHNLREPSRIRVLYHEIHELMAPGGLFVNLDYVRLSSPLLRPLADWAKADRDASFQSAGGGSGLPGTADEQVIWLREAGFWPAECFYKDFRVALFGGFKGEPHAPALERRVS